MHYCIIGVLLACIAAAPGSVDGSFTFKKMGWLDRLVAYYKRAFLEDVAKLPAVQIEVTIARPPSGYVDSPAWDADSVRRLVVLMSESETARPVLHALRRALSPSRRLAVGVKDSYKLFPSLAKGHPNLFYYSEYSESEDSESESSAESAREPSDDDVIYISNPVEARLPSARITVGLLRELLEARAKQARIMPTTQPPTISWKKSDKGNTTETDADGSTTGAGVEGTGTTAAGKEGGETTLGGETSAAA